MSLRAKLTNLSALVFAVTLGFVLAGTHLLFEKYIRELFYKRLESRAFTAAFFHLEKDELSGQKFLEIEEQYQQIHRESIRFFNEKNEMVFEEDTLDYVIPAPVLERIRETGKYNFREGDRQFAGIYYQDNQGDFVVLASDVNTTGKDLLRGLQWFLLVFFVLGLALNYFFTRFLARSTFKPFLKMNREVNAITADNLHARLEIPPGKMNELKQLMITFNYFLERLEAGVNSQRNFLKNVSHELKTPLAAILGELEVTLKKDRTADEYKNKMGLLRKDALHLKSILEGLIVLSGLEASEKQHMSPLRIDEVLWEVLEKIQIACRDADIQVDLQGLAHKENLLQVQGNKEILFIALSNLLDNAIKFSGQKPVTVRFSTENGRLVLEITDQGPGIPEEEQSRIFDLFYRGRFAKTTSGHGIGLYLTRHILDLHRVTLQVFSRVHGGTSIRLCFPPASSVSRLPSFSLFLIF